MSILSRRLLIGFVGAVALVVSPTMQACSSEAPADAPSSSDSGDGPSTAIDGAPPTSEASQNDAAAAVDCRDPEGQLKSAVEGKTTALLDAAVAVLSRDLSANDVDYLQKYNWAKATESDVAYDATIVKAVSIVGPLVDAACPGGLLTRRSTGRWSLVRSAHADDSRCLVASGIANVIAGAAVFAVGYAFCAATVNPLACVAATAIGIKLVRTAPSCTKPPPPDTSCGTCPEGEVCSSACGGCIQDGAICCPGGKGICPKGYGSCQACGSTVACLNPGGTVCPYPFGGFTQAACPGPCPPTPDDGGWAACSPCAQ